MSTKLVYAIGHMGHHIKFGVAADVIRRKRELQVNHPYQLTLISCSAQMPRTQAYGVEWLIHRAMYRFQLHGEWFKSCPATLAVCHHLASWSSEQLRNHYAQAASAELAKAIRTANSGTPFLTPTEFALFNTGMNKARRR
jgi:hypothetical protein